MDYLRQISSSGIDIQYEDADILVCKKASGIPTQTAKAGSRDVVSILKNYLFQQSEDRQAPYLAVIHRLDQPVEGLLVFAKTPFAARELSRDLQMRGFGKHYLAKIEGVPDEKMGCLEDYLVKDAHSNTSSVTTKENNKAKRAVLFYEVLEVFAESNSSLVKIRLETGRHHQIRVQMAHAGHPLFGDTKYNLPAHAQNRWQNIALCAYRLVFTHPRTKKEMIFETKPSWE